MTVVFLGSGGRLGRLLQPIYPGPAKWFTRADVDILDTQMLRSALVDATAVVCLAGVTNASQQPMEMNATIASCVLDAAAEVGAGHVLLFSSAAVYGNAAGLLHEDDPTTPLSSYGRAKREMEMMARRHRHPNTVLRLGNVAGADAILGNWMPGFLLDTFPDNTTPVRSYIGPTSLVRILFEMTYINDLPALINVAAPGTVQMGDLLNAAKLPWQSKPTTDQTIASVSLDTSVLEQLTNFDTVDSTPHGIVAEWEKAKAKQ